MPLQLTLNFDKKIMFKIKYFLIAKLYFDSTKNELKDVKSKLVEL